MKVLLTGSSGLLGSYLLRRSPKRFSTIATYNKITLLPNVSTHYVHMDITNSREVNSVLHRYKPDVVIHTAAIATPDYCDKHQDEAKNVNVTGTENILNACQLHKPIFVYVTTNGVYDGLHAPYAESAMPRPIDFYGKTKFKAEKLTQSSGLPFIIMRLITMYGWNNPKERQNPLTWLIDILGKNKTPVNIVSDMFNNFLSVDEAAKTIWKAVREKKIGESYNIAGKNCVSRFEFSRQIARTFNLDFSMIYPVPLSFFKNFVDRPKNTCFVTKKMERELGIKPLSIKIGLEYYKSHMIDTSAWKEL